VTGASAGAARSRDGADALGTGEAFVDLSAWRKVAVEGDDARGWLNDLLTADLSHLRPGSASRSLLLSATGRIRADVTVALIDAGFLLVQDPSQPRPIHELLAPYVLSSDVRLRDRSRELCLMAFPAGPPPDLPGADSYRPSALGSGSDRLAATEARRHIREAAATRIEADAEAVEAWRIRAGVARFPVDLREDSLPHEARLDRFIGYDKGCFLGQEAVAKTRNLGHPPFLLLAARTSVPIAAGDPIVDQGGSRVGSVTSATSEPEFGSALIARIRWTSRDAPLHLGSGEPLVDARPAAGRP
jgi:folate-binding protein YgfZ